MEDNRNTSFVGFADSLGFDGQPGYRRGNRFDGQPGCRRNDGIDGCIFICFSAEMSWGGRGIGKQGLEGIVRG